MTNNEILRLSLEKIKKNGFINNSILFAPEYAPDAIQGSGCGWDSPPYYFQIIFSHDFAKAFWGEELIKIDISEDDGFLLSGKIYLNAEFFDYPYYENISWQYHLQQMVLELEPLKYLEKFLE